MNHGPKLTKEEVIKKAKDNSMRLAVKSSELNMAQLTLNAVKYDIYQQDYIDTYVEFYHAQSKTKTLAQRIAAKARHNGTNAASHYDRYNEKKIKKAAQRYVENADIYYENYVNAFMEKRKKRAYEITTKNLIALKTKSNNLSSESTFANALSGDRNCEFDILIDAIILSESDILTGLPLESDRMFTPSYTNSSTESASEDIYSSDSEEFSFYKIKQMKRMRK